MSISQVLMHNLPIEEEQRAERLVLGGSRHVLVHGEVGEESLDLGAAHLPGVALVVKEDVAFDPEEVGLPGAWEIAPELDGFADLVEGLDHQAILLFKCWLTDHLADLR
jgi:hypothetical protein